MKVYKDIWNIWNLLTSLDKSSADMRIRSKAILGGYAVDDFEGTVDTSCLATKLDHHRECVIAGLNAVRLHLA